MSFGVLTGANSAFWPTLQALALACYEEDVPLAVADHGLGPDQQRILAGRGVQFLDDLPQLSISLDQIRKGHRADPMSATEAWWKPRVCLQSPFEATIWIDADAVPVRGLRNLANELAQGSWLTRDWWVDERHAHALYIELVKRLYGIEPVAYRDVCRINSGVFGFTRGDKWLKDWAEMCEHIVTDKSLLARCICRDQSALVALLSVKPANMPRILEDPRLNWPANGLRFAQRMERKRYDLGDGFLDAVIADHPDTVIVHWMGRPKPWEIDGRIRHTSGIRRRK